MPEVREERGLFQDDGIRENDFITALTPEALEQAMIECSKNTGTKICLLVPFYKDVNDIVRSFWEEYARSTLQHERSVDFVVNRNSRTIEFRNNSEIYVRAVDQTPTMQHFHRILADQRLGLDSLTKVITYCQRPSNHVECEPEIDTSAVNEWLNRFPVKDAD